MNGIIVSLLILVAGIVESEGVSVVTGPSDTAQEVGSRFKLQCVVKDKQSVDDVIWHLVTVNSVEPTLLAIDSISKASDSYEVDTDGKVMYNLIVKNATHKDDGVFRCEAGVTKQQARVYIYNKPDNITLDWEHSVNKEGAVEANREYKLKCTTKHSYPPATHRYYKDGVELRNDMMSYTYYNDTGAMKGYADVTSTLAFVPSQEDLDQMSTIRCVADLYNNRNVMSASFDINSALRVHSIGLGASIIMLLSLLEQRS